MIKIKLWVFPDTNCVAGNGDVVKICTGQIFNYSRHNNSAVNSTTPEHYPGPVPMACV
jgi:hypothetical protein